MGTDDEETQDVDLGEVLEWSAFRDDEGRIYYYNSVSGESSWDAPDKFNPPPDPEDGEVADIDPNSAAAGSRGEWVAHHDEEGREYYYNTITEETTWEKPEAFQSEELATDEVQQQDLSPARVASPGSTQDQGSFPGSDEFGKATPEPQPTEETEQEEEIDPAVKRLEEARNALKQTDAILEPGVMNHVMHVVTSEGGKAQNAIQALSESYFGETAACGLIARWLADLKSQAASAEPAEQSEHFSNATNSIRDIVQDVVNRISKERFTKTGGDSILDLSKSEAAFLAEMMDSNRWRKLLIDLSASNKDSALLMYCLEQISKRGHHREIARRINQSDHFAVFNAMLSSELTVIGKIAVSSCKGRDTSIDLEELVGDLQRTCTSTAYTYMYALEVLRHLVATATTRATSSAPDVIQPYARAIRKWERLNELLQSTMVDPMASAGSTPLFRKRRLDVAVTISELNQRQRRRLEHNDAEAENDGTQVPDARSKVESAVLSFLRKYSLGTQIDDSTLDKMLPSGLGNDPTNLIGSLLMKRPLTIKALLGYMYKPGSQRVSNVVTKNKCARLIALAVKAAEADTLTRFKSVNDSLTVEYDEVAVTRMLSEGSRLCETVENMVSFLVTSASDAKNVNQSPGVQLCSLALKCAPVSQGVAIWAREITKASDFVTSASYPTLSPSILSLIRVIYLKHPFIRDDALEVAFGFIKHSNSEISYQTVNEIKEQSLRLLIFLCARGEAPAVLRRMTKLLDQPGTSGLDASLVRYFVSGLLEVANVPFSVPFVRLFCSILMAQGTIEAVKTKYFDNESKTRLSKLLTYLGDLVTKETHGKLTPQDSAQIKSLVTVYQQ